MARLTRKNIKVFAGNATNNGVFGSLQANNPVTTNDVEQIQSLTAWGEGWDAATETSEDLPPLEEIQGVEYVTTYQQAYIMQEGIPEWAATVTYYKGCLAKEVTSTGFRIYNSLTDDNTGNLLSDTSNWKKVMDSDDLYAFDNTVVHKAGFETISGEKTFSVSPIVPTATSGDSSTKAASTEFVTTVASSLQTQINQKANSSSVVTLAGTETITGLKIIKRNGDSIQLSTPNITDSSTLGYCGIACYGNDSSLQLGAIEFYKNPLNQEIILRAYNRNNPNDNYKEALLHLVCNNNGAPYATAPASDINGSIVTTVNKSKAANGYFRLGNGLIIQWGHVAAASGDTKTVTFSTAFSNINYYVHSNINRSGSTGSGWGYVTSKTTTNCKLTTSSDACDWLAIGY